MTRPLGVSAGFSGKILSSVPWRGKSAGVSCPAGWARDERFSSGRQQSGLRGDRPAAIPISYGNTIMFTN